MQEGTAFDLEAAQAEQDKATESAELRQLLEDTDLEWLMNTQQGRRIMWRLLSLSGVYRLSYAAGDTHATAFAEGARNIGLQLMSEIQRLCPNLYGVMVKEQERHG